MSAAKRKKAPEEKGVKYVIITVVRGSLIGIALLFVFLLISSSIILKADLPTNSLLVFTLVSAALPSFAAGFIAVRPLRKNGIALGAMSTLPIIIVLTAAVAISAGDVGKNLLIASLAMVLSGSAGGIAAANKKKKRGRR